MAKKLFVGGLSYDTDENTLRSAFEECGTVASAAVITDRMSGRSKGFGFVEMSTDEEANTAIERWDGKELDGRRVQVSEARPQTERPDRGPRSHGDDRSDRGGSDRGSWHR